MSTPTRTPGQLKVSELKEELKKRGISPKGLKKDLVEKLEEVIQKEAEEQFGKTSSNNSSQKVTAGSNSPLPGSSDSTSSVPGSNCVDSPLPVADSTQDSSLLPSLADIRNEDCNSPLQVEDTKSSHYAAHRQVADHTNQGIFGRENAEVKGDESDCILQAVYETALEPEKMEHDIEQKEHDIEKKEHVEHFDSVKKSPLGLVRVSEPLCHDGMEGTVDDSETIHTVHRSNESGVDVSGPEALCTSTCFQKPGLGDEAEAKRGNSFDKDEMLILSHGGPSMVEKPSNTLSSIGKESMESGDADVQCQGLDPQLNRLGAEAKINSEKGEVFCISEKIADQMHSKTKSEYKLEKQEEKGNSLTAYCDENLKIPKTGIDSVYVTKPEVVAVSQEGTRVEDKYQSVSTDPVSYDFKAEPRHSYEESEVLIVKQEMVECEPHRETNKCGIKGQGYNSGKVAMLSGTDLNLEDRQRSESNPVVPENMEPRYAQYQFMNINPPTHGLEFKPETKHDAVEIDNLKQNKEEYYHSMGESTIESEKTEDKENTQSFEKGFKSNETNINLAEKQPTSEDYSETKAVKIQHVSSHYNPEVLKSEHTCNTEMLEAAHHKQNQAEYNYPAVMNELKPEDQEVKVIASTLQGDRVSILATSNIILEEMQQCKVVSYDEGRVEYQVDQIHQNSLDVRHHESVYESVHSIKEREAKELDQVMEDHHQCREMSAQESEQEKKVSLSGFENEKLLQSCATDSSMVEEGKQEIISALEDSIEREYSQSESIVQSYLFHESELKVGANAEVLKGDDQCAMKLRKEEHAEQEDKKTELIMDGEKTSQFIAPNELKRKSEFSDHQSQVDSDSPREMLRDSKTLKLGHTKTAVVAPVDVDFQEQIRKKQKDEYANEDGEPRQEPAKRQRRWNSGKNLLEAGNTKPLTIDTMKDIISPEGAEVSVASSSLHPLVSQPATPASQSLSKAEKTSFSRPAPPPLKSDSPINGEIRRPRIVPPPLRSPTSSLKVERFLRPFTVKALKELLSETGRVNFFWMDQIKTHCYVTYSSVEEAVATRNALYNLKWPINGGRFLIAEFVDCEEVKSLSEGQFASLKTTPNPVPHKNINQGPSPLAPQGSSAQALRSPPPPLPDLKAKKTMESKKDPEPEPAVYTLDDLFKKTRAKPHIYYLPLSEEQVASKLAARSRD